MRGLVFATLVVALVAASASAADVRRTATASAASQEVIVVAAEPAAEPADAADDGASDDGALDEGKAMADADRLRQIAKQTMALQSAKTTLSDQLKRMCMSCGSECDMCPANMMSKRAQAERADKLLTEKVAKSRAALQKIMSKVDTLKDDAEATKAEVGTQKQLVKKLTVQAAAKKEAAAKVVEQDAEMAAKVGKLSAELSSAKKAAAAGDADRSKLKGMQGKLDAEAKTQKKLMADLAAAVKANQLPTAEDKVKQGRGQQVRKSQLEIDMANPRVVAAVQTVMADSSIIEGTEESYQQLCECHTAVRQSLYMEMKDQTSRTMAYRLQLSRTIRIFGIRQVARIRIRVHEYEHECANMRE